MKRTTWALMIAAMLTAGMGLHLVVTQPLNHQIETLSSEVNELRTGMLQLADFQDEVSGTNDLLSGLAAQSGHIAHARSAIENMRRLQREVMQQSHSAGQARAALSTMGRLQSEVIAQSERVAEMQYSLDGIAECQQRAGHLADASGQLLVDIDLAEESLRQLGDFQQRVSLEASGLNVAANRFAELVALKESLEQVSPEAIDMAGVRMGEVDSLMQHIIDEGPQVVRARATADELIALQDEIVARGVRVEVAREHAEALLRLEELLANDAGRDIEAATRNLAGLLEIEEQLALQDQKLASAIESLELLQDLQSEFVERTRELENIRRGLTELILMESIVARTVRTLRPLAELADLRRLDIGQLQSIARSMVSDGQQRVALNHEAAGVTGPVRMEEEITLDDESLVPTPPAE
jgi:hypothetical protein